MDEIRLPQAQQFVRTGTPSNRSLAQYVQILRLDENDLARPSILDLGSGPLCQFASQLHAIFPATEITSFDACFHNLPDFLYPSVMSAQAVSGYFGALPFPDDSFDLVVSLFAFPLYVEGEAEVERSLLEICRVLAPGGKAKLAPLAFHRRLDCGPVEAGRRKELQEMATIYGPEFARMAPTVVETKQGLRETVLEDVSYGASPDAFDRILTNLPPCYRSIISKTTVPDVGPAYQFMLEIERSLTPGPSPR